MSGLTLISVPFHLGVRAVGIGKGPLELTVDGALPWTSSAILLPFGAQLIVPLPRASRAPLEAARLATFARKARVLSLHTPGGAPQAGLMPRRPTSRVRIGGLQRSLRAIPSRPVKYAKQNLRDVEDSAVQHGLSAIQEARFPNLGAEQTGMNFLIVKPGQQEATAHRHRTAEEIYVVLAGTGGVKLDDELVELAPLDAVRVGPGVARGFQAGPDGLEVLIFGPRVESDSEIVDDFWGE